jgi:diacylglycerol kinase family enzyme
MNTATDLHATTDARAWAQEWCRIAREISARGDDLIDEGWMIGWFANAIEMGRDAGRRAAQG